MLRCLYASLLLCWFLPWLLSLSILASHAALLLRSLSAAPKAVMYLLIPLGSIHLINVILIIIIDYDIMKQIVLFNFTVKSSKLSREVVAVVYPSPSVDDIDEFATHLCEAVSPSMSYELMDMPVPEHK